MTTTTGATVKGETIAIVGGGLAGATCCEVLRSSGFRGRILLVGAEAHLPYERPPLSKGFLMGSDPLEKAFVHEAKWYEEQGVELRLGSPVTALNLEAHLLETGGEQLGYDRLLIATGAAPRRFPLVDDSGAPVSYLRTIDDSRWIKAALEQGGRLAVVGGGWIGLEVAAAARNAGCEVVVVEPLAQPLLRVLGPEVAASFANLHREHRVDLRTQVSVTGVRSDAGRTMLGLSDGSRVTADALVVGVGVLPRAALAERAGLIIDNGIVVDEFLRTSDPDVFAAGDVANAYHPKLGRHVRVEHWDNAIQQGRVAALNMLGGDERHEALPYFFSDQYDLGMEYVGSVGPDGYDELVVRGDLPGRVFTAFWVKERKVLAGMHANDWDATDPIRRIVGGVGIDLEALRDGRVPLDKVVP